MKPLAAFVLIALAAGPLLADEADDKIAAELAAVVRDPRLPLPPRVAAARTLGRLGPKAAAAVPQLIAQVNRLRGRELEGLQEAVIDALGEIGPAAKPAIPSLTLAAGRSIDLDLAIRRSIEKLSLSGDAAETSALVQQLISRDSSVRLRAAKALGKLGPAAAAAVPNLVIALGDEDGDVRRAAVSALRLVQPDAKPIPELVQAVATDLRDPDDTVRLLAARTLGKFGRDATPAVPALQALLDDPDRDVRRAVADALTRIAGGP